jgi:hypothetical protein
VLEVETSSGSRGSVKLRCENGPANRPLLAGKQGWKWHYALHDAHFAGRHPPAQQKSAFLHCVGR